MTKAQAFVVVCAAIIIASCCVSWYLVTTVNPPQLTVQSLIDERRRMMYNIENDDVVAVPFEHIQDSLAPFYRFAPTNISKNPQKASEKSIFILPYTVRVSPPVESPWVSVTTSQNVTETSTQGIQHPGQNISWIFNLTEPKPTPVKGYRRSIKEDIESHIDGYSKFIILKIIDEHGRSRIEIKLNPDVESRDYENKNKGSSLKMQVSTNNVENSVKELGYNTEIKIMPNDNFLIASNSEILDMKSAYINNIFKENVTELKTKMAQKLSAFNNGTKSYLNETNSSNNVSKKGLRRLKPIHKENAKSIDTMNKSIKSFYNSKSTESNIIQNSTNSKRNETNKLTITSKSINKDTELKNNTIKGIISTSPTPNNTKTYNVEIETKNLSESKIFYLKKDTGKKNDSNATKDVETQETVNKNNTLRAETFKFRILLDNETKSFTEPFGIGEISLPSYASKDINNYNFKNDTNSISQSKYTVKTNVNESKSSDVTREIEKQKTLDKNKTAKANSEKSKLRVLFDNETTSFTKTIGTKTAVESVVVAVTDKL